MSDVIDKKPSYLLDLPTEILRIIASLATSEKEEPHDRIQFEDYLPWPCTLKSRQTKLALSQTSQTFRSITKQYLYEAVVLDFESAKAFFQDLRQSNLSSNGEVNVSNYVRMIQFREHDLINSEKYAAFLGVVCNILSRCDRVEAISIEICLDTTDQTGNGDSAPDHLSLSLGSFLVQAMGPFVKYLQLDIFNDYDAFRLYTPIIHFLLGRPQLCVLDVDQFLLDQLTVFIPPDEPTLADAKFVLPHLTHLVLSGFGTDESHLSLFTVHGCPNITHVKLGKIKFTTDFFADNDVRPTVISLHITSDRIFFDGNRTFAHIFPNLTSLTYEDDSRDDIWHEGVTHDKLESIVVEVREFSQIQPAINAESLCNNILSINCDFLPALKSLTLRWCSELHGEESLQLSWTKHLIVDAARFLRESGVHVYIKYDLHGDGQVHIHEVR